MLDPITWKTINPNPSITEILHFLTQVCEGVQVQIV